MRVRRRSERVKKGLTVTQGIRTQSGKLCGGGGEESRRKSGSCEGPKG